jgi:GntR family transcriptional repressor for pyruvate dehydrogenase complex
VIEPVSRTTLPQVILDNIVKAIKEGVWQPGSRIPSEQELATAFSVSRNSIREAVKTLNKMGVLESRPGQGTFLSTDAISRILYAEFIERGYEDATLLDITEIRVLLESQSAYWAAMRASDKELEELGDILRQSHECMENNLECQDQVHFAFHEALVRLSKNSFVIRLLSSIHAEIEAQRAKYEEVSTYDQMDLIRDQEEIIGAILKREPEKARKAMEKHLNKGLLLLAPHFPEAKLHGKP